MELKTYKKLKNGMALTDAESKEVVEYIEKCEGKIHKLQSKVRNCIYILGKKIVWGCNKYSHYSYWNSALRVAIKTIKEQMGL